MIVKNIKSGKKFTITKEEYDVIVSNGNSYKYDIIEDDSPIEVRSLRNKVSEEKEIKRKKNNV